MQKELQDIDIVLKDISEIKERLKILKSNEDVSFIENKDIEIIRRVKRDDRPQLKTALQMIHHLAEESGNTAVTEHIKNIFEHLEIMEELEKKNEEAVLSDFNGMTEREINNDSIKEFFNNHSNFFKAKPHKRLKKKIEKYLKSKMEEAPLPHGPIIKTAEVRTLKKMLHDYFNSDYFRLLMIKFSDNPGNISVGLFGSLVSGFASKESKFSGLPSDYKRISDVDIGIIVSNSIIRKINLGGRHLKKSGTYYGPFFRGKSEELGPFSHIFNYIKGLNFAGRSDRKIGIIVVDEDFYKHNLSSEEHIMLLTIR